MQTFIIDMVNRTDQLISVSSTSLTQACYGSEAAIEAFEKQIQEAIE